MTTESVSKKDAIEQIAKHHFDKLAQSSVYGNELKSAMSREDADAKGYTGREILELLQNADDAFTQYIINNKNKTSPSVGEKIATAKFELKGNSLYVSNTGAPFVKESFSSLCLGNASTKDRGKGFIGNKGIGFRSILNWAKKVCIYSDGFNVRFSPEFAARKLEQLKEQSSFIRNLCAKNSSVKYPILSAPEWIDKSELREGFDTTIKLELNESADVQKKIKGFDYYSLLFMQQIHQVTFETDDEIVCYGKDIKRENDVTLVSLYQETKTKTETSKIPIKTFFFFEERDENAFGAHLAVAIPTDFSDIEEGCMYTFFKAPLQKSPFKKALLHANFLLDSARNYLLPNENNDTVFNSLLKFYVKKVCTFFSKKEYRNINVKLLMMDEESIKSYSCEGGSDRYNNIIENYKRTCKENILLYTVNENFIKPNINEKPVLNYMADSADAENPCISYPEHFKGDLFKNLIVAQSSEENKFLLDIAPDLFKKEFGIKSADLQQKIEAIAEKCSPLENCRSFLLWTKWFLSRTKKWTLAWPKVLKMKDGCWASGTVFLPCPGLVPPSGVTLPQLEDEYYTGLQKACDDDSDLNLSSYADSVCDGNKKILLLNGRPYGFCSSKFNTEKLGGGAFKEVSYITIATYLTEMRIAQTTVIKWLYDNQSLLDENKLWNLKIKNGKNYIGADYENVLGEQIFAVNRTYKKAPSIDDFGISGDEKQAFTEFLMKIGYKKYPGPNARDRLEFFDKLDTKILVKWIFAEQDFYNSIVDKKEYSQLKQKKWVDINGVKIAPENCLRVRGKDVSLLKFFSGCITDEWIRDLEIDRSPAVVEELFRFLGICSSYGEMKSQDFYTMLLNMQDSSDADAKLYLGRIYSEIANGKPEEKPLLLEESEARAKFKREGKILTRNYELLPHNQVQYANKIVLNVMKKPLINVQPRKNGESVKKIFFVDSFQENFIAVDPFPSSSGLDEDFKNDLKLWLPCVYCLVNSNRNEVANVGKLRTLHDRIKLVSSVNVSYNEGNNTLQKLVDDPFELVEFENIWYICFNEIMAYDEFKRVHKVNLLKVFSSLLQSVLDIKDVNFYAELFVNDDSYRRYQIEEKLNDVSLLEIASAELYGRNLDKEKVVQKLREKFPSLEIDAESDKILDELNYSHLSHESQDEKIHNLLKKLGISVTQFNSCITDSISLARWNRSILNNSFELKRELITLALWNLAKNSADKRISFLENVRDVFSDFSNFNNNQKYEDVDLDASKIIQEFLAGKQILIPSAEQIEGIRTQKNEIFKANTKFLNQKIAELNHDFVDFKHVINNDKVKQAAYFDNQGELMSAFDAYVENLPSTRTEPPVPGDGPGEARCIKAPPPRPGSPTGGKKGGHTPLPPGGPTPSPIDGGPGRVVLGGNDDGKSTRGGNAEYFIFRMLQKKKITVVNDFFGEDDYDVSWISRYAVEFGIAVTPNDEAGYDFEVISKADPSKVLYIECKSSVDKYVDFKISAGELGMARQNPDKYLILFVPNSAEISLEAEKDVHDYIAIWYRDLDREYKQIIDEVRYVKK